MYLPVLDHDSGDGADPAATADAQTATADAQTATPSATILQCLPSSDQARQAKYEQDRARCKEIAAVWQPQSERRSKGVKAALMTLVDRMASFDTMQIIGFSARGANGAGVQTATAGWLYGTPVGKQTLKQALLEVGKTNADAYLTSGGTPSATALHAAHSILTSAPATSTDGRDFKHEVLFLNDGVANYFLNPSNPGTGFGWYNDAHDNPNCATRPERDYETSCQVGLTNNNPQIERPATAMVNEADRIKQLNGGNTNVYAITLGDFDRLAVAAVASQATFPYYSEVSTAAQLDAELLAINDGVNGVSCTPAGGTAWLGTIDGSHTVTDTAERSQFDLPADTSVYGYVYLSDANGQLLQTVPVRHDSNGQLSYAFASVVAGTYQLASYVAYKGDDQPTPIARAYGWILFPNLYHETSLTFSLAPTLQPDPVPLNPLYLDLQGSVCLPTS
jgi:hypothetical protein